MKIRPESEIQVIFKGDHADMELLQVKGNGQMLRKAFMNLMENGCKYSEDHRVVIYLERVDQTVHLIFSDQGMGIPENEQEMIFEPFFRSKQSHGKEGYGIGLALVKRVVTIHGGEITLKSVHGSGTEFTIILPCICPA